MSYVERRTNRYSLLSPICSTMSFMMGLSVGLVTVMANKPTPLYNIAVILTSTVLFYFGQFTLFKLFIKKSR